MDSPEGIWVNISARVLLDIYLIWFGYITRLSQLGAGRYFNRSNDYYLPSVLMWGGGGVSTLWYRTVGAKDITYAGAGVYSNQVPELTSKEAGR